MCAECPFLENGTHSTGAPTGRGEMEDGDYDEKDCVDAGVERGTAAGAELSRTQASQGDVRPGLGP